MNDYLYCPICGREMKYKLEPQLSFGHYIAPDRHWFTCDKDHERVLVSIEDNQLHHIFVYLGDGCYVFGDFDNTSCEKAIARMKREYYESPEYVTSVMEKSYQPDGRHCGMIID